MPFSLKEIAAAYKRPVTTTGRHIRDYIERQVFIKRSPGVYYDEGEVQELAALMRFDPADIPGFKPAKKTK